MRDNNKKGTPSSANTPLKYACSLQLPHESHSEVFLPTPHALHPFASQCPSRLCHNEPEVTKCSKYILRDVKVKRYQD